MVAEHPPELSVQSLEYGWLDDASLVLQIWTPVPVQAIVVADLNMGAPPMRFVAGWGQDNSSFCDEGWVPGWPNKVV
eukprot:CAMPEP_0117693302 /NCGR_PEP_ID=MMETSP0804-20121206/26810_1 /TAXON_ID=1074897 /ORGANISM="Tetraselmis astigmatica, Strain CCMP880" /LENGTH=76 /DNA_ID=CAMNT_0005506851 /DNA_START=1079 /DNA_END=1309 /DNA_ORIENTATION=-